LNDVFFTLKSFRRVYHRSRFSSRWLERWYRNRYGRL